MLAPQSTETQLRDLTWEYCGIVRNASGLEAAIHALDRIVWEPVATPSLQAIELRNLHDVAALIARCALAREESRGAHYRTDFPEKREARARPSIVSRGLPATSATPPNITATA